MGRNGLRNLLGRTSNTSEDGMNEIEKNRVHVLIEICTRSLSQMILAAAVKPDRVEDGRKSLNQALVELAEITKDVERTA